jgi:outer membrane protein assembly factor BamB
VDRSIIKEPRIRLASFGVKTCAALMPLLCVVTAYAQSKSRDWLTWGNDPERTGWSQGETTLSLKNVGGIDLKWKTQIDKQVPIEVESGAAVLTAPLVVENVTTPSGYKDLVFTLAASNRLVAVDSANGGIVWQKKFENKVAPKTAANWVCTNTPTATPLIDKPNGIIYVISADGVLHELSITNGEDKMPPTDFVPPYSRNWSLNLIGGVLYSTVGRGCGNADITNSANAADVGRGKGGSNGRGPVASEMVAMDLNDGAHPMRHFATSTGRPGGAWSRQGMAWGQNSLLTQTADGALDPATNKWGNVLLRLAPKTLQLLDYFVPPNVELLNTKDLDFGSSGPLAFSLKGRELVAAGGKDGTIYLLDAKSLGSPDHKTPLFQLKIGNDAELYASNGIWGALATAVDSKGERWIYVPMWGPPSVGVNFKYSNGEAVNGCVMGFRVDLINQQPVLVPVWVSRDMSVPDPPVVANGLVFAISTGENTIQRHTDPRYIQFYQRPDQPPLSTTGILTPEERGQHVTHAILYAFDAANGNELYSSKDTIDDWTHFSSVTVAGGQIYLTTRRSLLYAFGLRK